MYKGMILPNGLRRQPKRATGQSRYGLKNKIHSVQVSGMGEDYYGPPAPGQTWNQYETFMSAPIATMGGAAIGALVAGPVGAIVGGIGSWLLNDSTRHMNKPKTQGG